MKEHYTLTEMSRRNNVEIRRISFVHMLLVRAERIFQADNGSIKELYWLFRQSKNKNWMDISVYNFNEDARVEYTKDSMIIQCDDGNEPICVNKNMFHSDLNLLHNVYRMNVNQDAQELITIKMVSHLWDRYNIPATVLNIKEIKTVAPVGYYRESKTKGLFTLYFFYYYYLDEWKSADDFMKSYAKMPDIFKRSMISFVNSNEFGFFDSINPDRIKNRFSSISYIKSDGYVLLEGGEGHTSVMFDDQNWIGFCKQIQADIANRLAQRSDSILLPDYMLKPERFANEKYNAFHPSFKFHGFVDLVLREQSEPGKILAGSKEYPGITIPLQKEKSSQETGYISIRIKYGDIGMNLRKSTKILQAINRIINEHYGKMQFATAHEILAAVSLPKAALTTGSDFSDPVFINMLEIAKDLIEQAVPNENDVLIYVGMCYHYGNPDENMLLTLYPEGISSSMSMSIASLLSLMAWNKYPSKGAVFISPPPDEKIQVPDLPYDYRSEIVDLATLELQNDAYGLADETNNATLKNERSRFTGMQAQSDGLEEVSNTVEDSQKPKDHVQSKLNDFLTSLNFIRIIEPKDKSTIETLRPKVKFHISASSYNPVNMVSISVNNDSTYKQTIEGVFVNGDYSFDIEIPAVEDNHIVSVSARKGNVWATPSVVRFRYEPPMPNLKILAIGINDYSYIDRLESPSVDVEGFISAMKKQQDIFGDIHCKTNLDILASIGNFSRENIIQNGFKWIIKETSKGDMAILFLSGHGFTDASQEFYFMLKDSHERDMSVTGLSLTDMLRFASELNNKDVGLLIIIDACRTNSIRTDHKYQRRRKYLLQLELFELDKTIVFFSTSGGKSAYEYIQDVCDAQSKKYSYSLFTGALIKVLNGEVAGLLRQEIRIKDLEYHVSAILRDFRDVEQEPELISLGDYDPVIAKINKTM